MSEEVNPGMIEVTDRIRYVYTAIPREYVCVYHRILAMMADYGKEMLKDCKASCTDRNSNIIECFNMFNAAIAADKLGRTSLARTIINYVKAKIEQIYNGRDNSTSFTFPVDENGEIHAFVSCEQNPRLYINPSDGELFNRIFRPDGGIQQQYFLGEEDEFEESEITQIAFNYDVDCVVTNHVVNGDNSTTQHEFTIEVTNIEDINGDTIDIEDCDIFWTLNGNYYTDLENVVVDRFNSQRILTIVVYYNGRGVIHTVPVSWNIIS